MEVIEHAVNGKAALPKIAGLKPDIVIMDVEMPEMNGVQTVKALRDSGFKAPILMFSTVTKLASDATLDALSAGASGYLNKPNQRQDRSTRAREPREFEREDEVPTCRRALSQARRSGSERISRPPASVNAGQDNVSSRAME